MGGLYAKGDGPNDRPVMACTMFQVSDSLATYDHRPDTKTRWRTAMLYDLSDWHHGARKKQRERDIWAKFSELRPWR